MTPDEEAQLAKAIKAARTVQSFLWGHADGNWGIEEWRRMFRKRVAKIDAIQPDNPHAVIEMKKRLLQQAALSIALLALIERGNITWEPKEDIPSNLPQHAERLLDDIEG